LLSYPRGDGSIGLGASLIQSSGYWMDIRISERGGGSRVISTPDNRETFDVGPRSQYIRRVDKGGT